MSLAKRLIPLLDRILVERIAPQIKTAGGLLIPESAQQKINQGLVVAVGQGARTKDGSLIPMNCKVGDKVLLPEYGGTAIKLGDKEVSIFRDEDILALLKD